MEAMCVREIKGETEAHRVVEGGGCRRAGGREEGRQREREAERKRSRLSKRERVTHCTDDRVSFVAYRW